MPILRMQAPEGLSSFTHEGHPAEIGSDGVVQIDHRHAEAYMQHGFTLRDEPRRPPLAGRPGEVVPTPQQVEAFLTSRDLKVQTAPVDPSRVALADRLASLPQSAIDRLLAALQDDRPDVRLDAGAGPLMPPPADPAVIHEADPRPATEPGPIPTEGPLTDEQIARMTPAQMKAWLKARDVPMIGVGNDADVLREKVRASNRG